MAPAGTRTSSVEAWDKGTGLRVLIVEDAAECAESLALFLRHYGHEAEVAPTGPAALEIVRTHEPDVLLLDICLPGMSGHEVARRVCSRRPRKTPLLIALTGLGDEDDVRRSREAGFDLHLVKPVDPKQLRLILERFRQILGGRAERLAPNAQHLLRPGRQSPSREA